MLKEAKVNKQGNLQLVFEEMIKDNGKDVSAQFTFHNIKAVVTGEMQIRAEICKNENGEMWSMQVEDIK